MQREWNAGTYRSGSRTWQGIDRRRIRVLWGKSALAALLLALLLAPLIPTPAVLAQDQAPPIVAVDDSGVVDDNANAAVDAQTTDQTADTTTQVDTQLGASVDDQSAAPAADANAAPALAAPNPNWSPPSTVYIPETGQTIDGVFLDLWRGWGGANGFGNPITPEMQENGHTVQYYGYARLEYWPDDPNGNVVHFGDLGSEMRPYMIRRGLPGSGSEMTESSLAARAWLPLDAAQVKPDAPGYRYVAETKHSVSGDIKAFWEAGGEEDFLGNPLTEPYTFGDNTYQVFERGKVVQEPGGSPYLLPAGELVAARYQLNTAPVAEGNVPSYSEELFVPPPPPTPVPASPTPADSSADAPADTPAEAVPEPTGEKWIQVSLSQQYAIAYQGDTIVWEGYVSTGREGFETPVGTFHILTKLDSQTMEGVIGGEYYNVPDVPWVMYFTDLGHALHGTYWHNNFGTPMSHGCVNLPMDVAEWMYQWAPIGTRVEIVP